MEALKVDVIDGSELVMTVPRQPTFLESSVALSTPSIEVSLQSAGRDKGYATAFDPNINQDFEITHELGYLGGQMWAGYGAVPEYQPDGVAYEYDPATGAMRKERFVFICWETQTRSISSHRYGGEPEHLLDLYSRLEFTEHENGVECGVLSGSGVTMASRAKVLLRVPECGIIEVAQDGHPDLPPAPHHPGTRVAGGEAYGLGSSGHHGAVLLISRTALALVHTTHESTDIGPFIDQTTFVWSGR